MSDDVEILAVDRSGAVALAGELGRVHGLAWAAAGCDEQRVESFRTKQLPRHAGRDGFRCVVARCAGRTVGFGYGYTGQRGQGWSDWVAARVPAVLADEWIGGHFEVVELAVAPTEQGLGIGGILHRALMADLPHERALLSTYRDGGAAVRLFRRRGWMLLWDRIDDASALYGNRLMPPAAAESKPGGDTIFS